MNPPIARIPGPVRRNRRRIGLAALLAGTSLSLSMPAAMATDPLALMRAAGIDSEALDAAPATAGTGPSLVEKRIEPPAEFAGEDGVLALLDGRVVFGKITPAPGGYLVKRTGAPDEMIPTFLVQTASDSLTGCYENLRDAIRTPRPDDHLELAQWCIRQRLLNEAKTELLAVLKLDPNRREARDLMVKLEEATSPRPRNRQSEAAPARTGDGFLDSSGRTTEGLGPENTSLFVRRIQPILVSKCGNAACHGGNLGGEFHVANIRRASSSGRMTTLENLRQVMSLVDHSNPADTRLLSALSSPAHASVFAGTGGEVQRAKIEEWIVGAADDIGLRPDAPVIAAGAPVWTPETIELASAKRTVPAEGPSRGNDSARSVRSREAPRLQRAETPPMLKKVSDDALLEETILKQERPDPFDPEEFNRMVHAQVGDRR
ncbi:hypothetical protein Pan44_09820 [Caulifigura coniformis]|uniref:Uncharacterized protein n=1 Tax=Caulifigura coniformis TaxID=2527983 RepID=A0A517SA19_9PLAN|nr:hypothetical protein [Caulifigura coniformis]QDT52968.1 hypothetical protein Pan44_09820 [Caulifigura coniformis]